MLVSCPVTVIEPELMPVLPATSPVMVRLPSAPVVVIEPLFW